MFDSDGDELDIDEVVDGGPSVLFDAIAIVLTEDSAAAMVAAPAARDFVTDAHAHNKFVACGPNAEVLLDAAGVDATMRDNGYLQVTATKKSADAFVAGCRPLRYWEREMSR
ncbi:MAG: hypothetical protein R2705_15405 [Ilumatobacteraceae bacterium]